MAKKRRTFGKTAKQWDKLFNEYKEELRGRRDLIRLTKTEFKEVWTKRAKGTTVKDIARQTAKDSRSSYELYKKLYSKLDKQGYALSKIGSERGFKQQLKEYGTVRALVESHLNVSKKQANKWFEKYNILKKKYYKELTEKDLDKLTYSHFRKGEKEDETHLTNFFALIDELGGWNEVFEYGA